MPIVLRSLTDATLRWKSPLEFNDPFDSQWDLGWVVRTPEFEASFREHSRRVYCGPIECAQLSPGQRSLRVRLLAMQEPARTIELDRQLDEALEEIQRSSPVSDRMLGILRRMRLLCMSSVPDSMLMWSHYATDHKGAVLGFDANLLYRAFGNHIAEVRYESGFPLATTVDQWIESCVYNGGIPNPSPESISLLWKVKARHWDYEKEWRFARLNTNDSPQLHEDIPFPREALRCVLLGCRAADDIEREVQAALAEFPPGVRVQRLRASPIKFAVEGFEHLVDMNTPTKAGGTA